MRTLPPVLIAGMRSASNSVATSTNGVGRRGGLGFRGGGSRVGSIWHWLGTGAGPGAAGQPAARQRGSSLSVDAGGREPARGPCPRRDPGRPSAAPGSSGLTSNFSPSTSTTRALTLSSWNGAEKATTWPSLPGSRVPSRRSSPAIAAAWIVSAASGLVRRQPRGDELANLRREPIQPLEPLGGEGERDARPGQGRRGRDLFLPDLATVDQDPERFFLLDRRTLAILVLGGELRLLGEIEPEDHGNAFRFQPVDDLGGLSPAHDHGGRAELRGQVEGAVDLVASVRLPPDRQRLLPGRPERLSAGSYGGPAPAPSRSSSRSR